MKKEQILVNIEECISLIKRNALSYSDKNLFDIEFRRLADSIDHDRELFEFFFINYHTALQECRKNNVINAENILVRINKIVPIDSLDGDEKKLFLLVSHPINAYIQYKLENFRVSEELTISTMILDQYFEALNPAIFFHKIQQLQNISRIRIRCNEYSTSAKIINILFSVLIFNCQQTYQGLSFGCDTSINEFSELKKLMVTQIFNEWINTLDNIDNEKERNQYFSLSAVNLPLENMAVHDDYSYILLSIGIIKSIIIENDIHDENITLSINNLLGNSKDYYNSTPLQFIQKLLN